jgi:hypothetical protein
LCANASSAPPGSRRRQAERIAIFDQALDSFVVFDAPGFDEGVERHECILLGLGHPDLLERTLGFRLLALWQLVEAFSAGEPDERTDTVHYRRNERGG